MENVTVLPKVSIVIPVYNGMQFLKEAIDSAIMQTYKNIEVIVVNDGSTDNGETDSVCMSYGERIRYFKKPNGGVSTALNLGIQEMSGEYFSWLSHDDVYPIDKIERQINFLRSDGVPPDAILYGGYEIINETSRTLDIVDPQKLYTLEQLNTSLFPVLRGLANGCTMLIHRSHFQRVGKFREDLRTTQDYELWFRMFRGAVVRFVPNVQLKSRLHRGQTGRIVKSHNQECDRLWIWMISSVTLEEMIQMEGSAQHFYYQTYLFLKHHSNYSNAEKFVKNLVQHKTQKAVSINKYPRTKTMSSGSLYKKVIRLFWSFRYDGVVYTLRKVVKKIF